MDTLWLDLRYGARRLARSPGFALVAVLTLALGIGANSAIFSVVNAVLLRPLPYDEGDRLVRVYHLTDTGDRSTMSPANFRDVRAQTPALEELSFFTSSNPTLTGAGDPVQLKGALVGQNFFQVLRAQPLLGRVFVPEENEPGRNKVAVLAHSLWQQRFGGDRGVVGRTISLYGEPHQVVGVMPPGFSYPSERDVWVPEEYNSWFMTDQSRGAWYISAIGRLKPGATAEQASREAGALAAQLEQQFPESNTNLSFTAVPLYEVMVGDIRPALLVLLGAVGLVLLIACANVANLLLARASARESELAVRAALGAGRGRLVRQLLSESVLLGVLGGAAGLVVAVWGTSALVALEPRGIPRLDDVEVNLTVVGFTMLVSVLAGVLFGMVPAIQVTRSTLGATLREGGRGALAGRGSARVRNTLVVAEMALAVMLLAGAGLLIRSFVQLQGVDPGFRSSGAAWFGLSLPDAEYDTEQARAAFFQQAVERMRAIPGVTSAGAVSDLPMGGSFMVLTFDIGGREPAQPGDEPAAQILRATPGYFQSMAIPLLRGRGITADDRIGAPPVVVLSQEAARRYFPGEDPIGQRILLGMGEDTAATPREVVGVVGDVRHEGMETAPEPALYMPQAQAPAAQMDIVLRTSVPPASVLGAVRREVKALDPNLPVSTLEPLEQVVAESVSQPRFYMLLLTVFAGTAVLLAAIGIFGVISYAVTQRTREIGVRMALGADPSTVVGLVIRGVLTLAGLGVGVGLVGALLGTRLLRSQLYGVTSTDLPTYAAVAAILLGVAALAGYLPARRATRVDPVVALRTE